MVTLQRIAKNVMFVVVFLNCLTVFDLTKIETQKDDPKTEKPRKNLRSSRCFSSVSWDFASSFWLRALVVAWRSP
jgi:hypothetical protein